MTGGLGLKAALSATTKLTKVTGTLVAANSVETTGRGVAYVAGGEQTKSTVNHVADALGATSPVANAYTSLALSTALGGPSMVHAVQKAKATRAAAQVEARNAQADNGTTVGTAAVTAAPAATTTASTAATTLPAAGTTAAPPPAAGATAATAALKVMDAGKGTADKPTLRSQLIEKAGETQVPGNPQATFNASVKRQLDLRNSIPANHPVRVRATAIERELILTRALPDGLKEGEFYPSLTGNMMEVRQALAFQIANNPIAYRTWQTSVRGHHAELSGRPAMNNSVKLYDTSSGTELASATPGRPPSGGPAPGRIALYMPRRDGQDWQHQTITGMMSFFTHEGHHLDTGMYGANKAANVALPAGLKRPRAT